MKRMALTVSALTAVLTVGGLIVERFHSRRRDKRGDRNPFEGKRVRFVESDTDPLNADGVRGHLEVVGTSEPHKQSFYERYVKRLLDVSLSSMGLIVLSPILLVISVAVYLDDPGPVLFTQRRIGINKSYFNLHKFRSMRMDTPHDVPTHQLADPESYITGVGRVLRRTSLDELPQIYNIWKGDMSIIGPRPALWNQDLLTACRDEYGVNEVKPGLTGLAQISGRDELEIPDKAAIDGEYTSHISFGLDLKCFLGTVASVMRSDGIVEGGTGAISDQ